MPYRPPDPRNDPATMEAGTVYVLHFSKPVGNSPRQQAQHYIGWATDPEARIRAHREKRGGALTRFAVQQGAELIVADLYPNVTRDFERRIKGRGARCHCSICKAEDREKQAAYQRQIDNRKARRIARGKEAAA